MQKVSIRKILAVIEEYLNDGYSLGYAKQRAIVKYKLNKEQEAEIAASEAYMKLKAKQREILWENKRFIKKGVITHGNKEKNS